MSNLPQELFIIYNPQSTGNSEANAVQLAEQLKAAQDFEADIHIICSERDGGTEDVAYALAMSAPKALIISSSGDGGYNEVINGALRAKHEGADPICGLLPSGNANDHYRNLHSGPIVGQIIKGKHRSIDVLQITGTRDGKPWQRLAHSYIGVGLTPKVGRELNKVQLNRFREAWIVVRTLYKLRGSRLVVRGRERTYDSLIFSNVGKMSKILNLSDLSKLEDGKFEIIAFPSRTRLQLLWQLVRATTVGLHTERQARSYSFSTIAPTSIQLDGEVYQLDGHSQVKVSLLPRTLKCII